MKILALSFAAWLFAQAQPDFDWSGFLERFGFPLAALVLILITGARGTWVWGSQLKAADERTRVAERERDDSRAECRRLQDERLRDAQQALAGFGTRLHDTALLVERGTRIVAEAAGPPAGDVDALRAEVRALTASLRGVAGDRRAPGAGGPGGGEGSGDGAGDRGGEEP